jgi:O-antigen/teichoic acid export membrane protein
MSTEPGAVVPPVQAAAPARRVGIGTHYLRYSTANALVLLAGLVSFPALTRLLDNTQYGILGYYETWVMMAVAVAKLGAQHAIIRFYPHGGDAARMTRFATNLFLLPLLVSTCLWLVAATVLACLAYFGAASFSPVLWCAVLAIPLSVGGSLVQMVMRAGEQSGVLMLTRVSARWLELVVMLAAVVLIERSALAAYGGRLVAGVIVAAWYARWARRQLAFSRQALDTREFADALRYGMPLVVNEIATVALISIDRVMLKWMLDDYAIVGIYTIGYSLAIQVSIFMSASLSESFLPVANRLYATDGAAAVRALKAKVLLPMTYASIGIAAAIWSVGSEVLGAVSGPDKVASGPVFAWIGALYALYPLFEIGGYGLLLHKRTMVVLRLTLVAAAINIGLNLALIPALGMMGAVYATAVAYGFLGIAMCALCPRDLLQLPDARSLVIALASAALFLAAIDISGLFGLASAWPRLFTAGGLWLVLYVVPVVLVDRRMRAMLLGWLRQRLRGARGARPAP